MTHLSRDELRRWWDEGAPTDRDRIVGHLAVCDECGALYGQVMDERLVESANVAAVRSEMLAAGYAAYRGAAAPRAIGWRLPWVAALAVAATLVLAFALYPVLRRHYSLVETEDAAVRGTTIQALSPSGTVAMPVTFRWSSPVDAATYELDVRDARGRIIWSTKVETTLVEAPTELLTLVEPGESHSWQVTALSRRGERMLQSDPQPFVVGPRER